ncbi:MAG: 2-C-methyl-D-erythritol 2,4-cyclodiphosphate synthase [Deltaproteobacteria bacterium]|nr:2-C-methyl-D-erythritol 2,4-cyclodiphosphate synthase [Deltaproteobacteria bacterium]
MRIGQGFDVHALVEGRPLILAGIEIPHVCGPLGHSDGDVVLHAISDALLGALAEGDLGRHFPSSDASLKGIKSAVILEKVLGMMRSRGCSLASVDCTVVLEAPRLSPHQSAMHMHLAGLLGIREDRLGLKVTSTDGLGLVGRGEGIACMAVVLLDEA